MLQGGAKQEVSDEQGEIATAIVMTTIKLINVLTCKRVIEEEVTCNGAGISCPQTFTCSRLLFG